MWCYIVICIDFNRLARLRNPFTKLHPTDFDSCPRCEVICGFDRSTWSLFKVPTDDFYVAKNGGLSCSR